MYRIFYEVPTVESRGVSAIAQVFKNTAYIMLVDGSSAGLNRRGAQINEVLASWKPVNFFEENIKKISAKKWTEKDYAEFERFVNSAIQTMKIPGIAIAIISNNKDVYSKGFGIKK
ncbi:MAG: hypothetical protein HQK51_14315 [Oligoflexia bacterium]|nr:hypothetical protein [Oligoflexia bacterium]